MIVMGKGECEGQPIGTSCMGGTGECDGEDDCIQYNLDGGLVSHWKFENNANDSAGSNHGVVYGTLLEFDSAGYDDSGGSHIYLKVNGLNKLVDGGRGHNAIRLNSTGDYIESKHWDTYDGFTSGHASASTASDDLTSWLNSLPNGDIVLMGVSDSAENINANAKNTIINKLGSTDINFISLRSSWGIIGVIGEGKKTEDYKLRYTGPSTGSWNGYNYNSYIGGIQGKALNFDGVNDYVAIGDKADILSGGLTVSAWIKPTTTNGVHLIVGKGNDGSTDDNLLNYEIYQNGNEFGFKVGDGVSQYASSKSASLDTNWHHVVGVYNGTSVISYVDGVSGSFAAAPASLYDANLLLIGLREISTNAYPFNGSIDEVRIWNRSLSEGEVKYLYESYS